MKKQRFVGAALIELTLVLPLLLAIIIGVLYYGYAFVLSSAAQNAARLGAEAAMNVDPLVSSYSNTVVSRARAEAMKSLDWLPKNTVSVSASVGAPLGNGVASNCQNISADSIVVGVVIQPNAGEKVILPVLSLGGYRIPPGLPSVGGQVVVTGSACAQL